jgi:hypothetical protein
MLGQACDRVYNQIRGGVRSRRTEVGVAVASSISIVRITVMTEPSLQTA